MDTITPKERTQKQIDNNFVYHTPTPEEVETIKNIREKLKDIATYLNESCKQSRELSLALTHLEETMMWANASIVRN